MNESISALSISETKNLNFSNKSLIIPENISLTEWQKIGQFLKSSKKAVQFWIGDWLTYGEKQPYGEKYTESAKMLGLKPSTLRNLKYCSSNIPESIRSDKLDYSHHLLVAGLDFENQKKYINIAVKHKLSVKGLREFLIKELKPEKVIPIHSNGKNNHNAVSISPDNQNTIVTCPNCTHSFTVNGNLMEG